MSAGPVRHQLGLPPKLPRHWPVVMVLAGAICVSLAAGVVGYIAGEIHSRMRLITFARETGKALQVRDPQALQTALAELERQRASLVRQPEARILMAKAYLRAAAVLPRQQPYREQAFSEIKAAKRHASALADNPGLERDLTDLESMVLMDLDRHQQAKAAFDRLQAGLDKMSPAARRLEEIQFSNNLAYLLASSPDPRVRDPEAALALAEKVIKSDQLLPGQRHTTEVAAYLDTLAEAMFASGKPEEAVRIQRSALALAQTPHLVVYLKHYEKYAKAAKEAAPKRQVK